MPATQRTHVERNLKNFVVLSAGIEPTLHPPQGCVLSVERRERSPTILEKLLRRYLFRQSSLHAVCGIFLDEAALQSLINRLLCLWEERCIFGLHEVLHGISHCLCAAHVEYAPSSFGAMCFLCGTGVCHARDSTVNEPIWQVFP